MSDVAPRARRVSDRIKVIIAEALEFKIKDPRVGFITITDVHITNDLGEATVYYTVLGDEDEGKATAAALESAKGVLRSEVSKETGLRTAPTLAFVADSLPEEAAKIEDLLAQARKADEELARQRESSGSFAGDPDPYDK